MTQLTKPEQSNEVEGLLPPQIVIGNPLMLSPDFPPLHTVHATFTAHGVPSNLVIQGLRHFVCASFAKFDLWPFLHRLLFHGFIGTTPLLSLKQRMVIAFSRRYSHPPHHWLATASVFPAFHVPIFLSLDIFRFFL